MDITKEVATHLANNGFGTLGTDIFVSQIPSDQNGIYVSITGGSLDYYTSIEDAVLDIYAKDTSATDAITTLNNIKKHLHRMHTTITAKSYIYSILAIGNVETIERDLEYAKLFKQTYIIKFRDTALIS